MTSLRMSRPYIRTAALLLLPAFAAQLLLPPASRAEGGGAGGKGSVALLPLAGPADAPAVALWEASRRSLAADPALVAQDTRKTADLLAAWAEQRRRAEGERSALALALRGEVDRLRQEAWKAYYGMDFAGAAARARKAAEASAGLDDGALAAEWGCEAFLLLGMSRRAEKDPGAAEDFLAAARLRPQAVLPPARYSPEIVAAFASARGKALAGPRSALSLTGGAPGSEALLDGAQLGAPPLLARELLPGPHQLEVRAEGYVPLHKRVDLPAWGTAEVACVLETAGPAPGEDASVYLSRRARAGDAAALRDAARRLGVSNILWAEAAGNALTVWRSDAAGTARSRAASTEPEAAGLVSDLRASTDTEALEAVSLPALASSRFPDGEPFDKLRTLPVEPPAVAEKKNNWIWWVLGGLALAGAAAGGGGGSSGGVSVSW